MQRFLKTIATLVAAILVVYAPASDAQYPNKPVRVIVSGPAGGPLDIVTRTVADKLRERLGQPFVVDNRAGGGGIIATTAVARAQPDGHTLLSTIDPPIVVNPALMSSVPYDPIKDLVPVAMIGDGGDNLLVVPAESPVKSVSELTASLRTQPERANYSSSGNGGPGHILGELFNRQAAVSAQHVPYKGAPDALNAVLAARVSFAFIPVGLALPQVQAGKARALAVAARQRNPLLPEIPTVAESGIKGFNPVHWWIVAFAPAGTPKPVVQKLNEEIRGITNTPEVSAMLRNQALRPANDAPDAVAVRVKNDYAYWSRVIKELGLRID